MRCFSEETVKKVIIDTVIATLHIAKPSEDYPYIEIPDHHGDLISKKALEVQIAHAFHGNMFPDISAGLALNKVMNIITDAPTIVEATT